MCYKIDPLSLHENNTDYYSLYTEYYIGNSNDATIQHVSNDYLKIDDMYKLIELRLNDEKIRCEITRIKFWIELNLQETIEIYEANRNFDSSWKVIKIEQ